MKLKASKSEIKNGFNTVLSIGYCDCQYLMYYKNPFAYSCGVYGWSCDYYQIGTKCISTGYSPIGTKVNYKKLRDLEQKAQKIVHNLEMDHNQKVAEVDLLINELINESLN